MPLESGHGAFGFFAISACNFNAITINRQHRLQRFDRLAMVAALALAACGRDTPEQAVRKQVDAIQAAIDARDAGAVHDLLAAEFVGNDGMDRRAVRQLAAAVFLRHRDVNAKVGPVDVELRGESDAIARFSSMSTVSMRLISLVPSKIRLMRLSR